MLWSHLFLDSFFHVGYPFQKVRVPQVTWKVKCIHTYVYINTPVHLFVSVLTHTHRYLPCVHILESPAILPCLREQRSPKRTQMSLAQRMSPQSSLANSDTWRSLVLRGWKAESGPISGIAEKHKKCCFGCSPESGTLAQGLPHHCHAHSLYTVFPNILVDKDVLTKRKWSSFFFLLFFYAIMHLSLLSCHHRGDVVAGSCSRLPLPSEAAIEDSAQTAQRNSRNSSPATVWFQPSDAGSSVVLKSP